MNDTPTATPDDHIEMTTSLVSAYVANNRVPLGELPALIQSIHTTIAGLSTGAVPEPPPAELKPFVSPKKSVTEDYIVSLEDGRRFKSMKRYLAGLGMTPDQYRAKWGLPKDYPMVCPSYAKKRSELAQRIGLGRKTVDVAAESEESSAPAPKRRGRAKAS